MTFGRLCQGLSSLDCQHLGLILSATVVHSDGLSNFVHSQEPLQRRTIRKVIPRHVLLAACADTALYLYSTLRHVGAFLPQPSCGRFQSNDVLSLKEATLDGISEERKRLLEIDVEIEYFPIDRHSHHVINSVESTYVSDRSFIVFVNPLKLSGR